MNTTKLNKAIKVAQKRFEDILTVVRIDDITIVVLEDGSAGASIRKKGDTDKPLNAIILAYHRAKSEQVLERL